jgi:hypothetical protein
MLRLRRIVFYIFASLYLVLCPLTISYALGYWFRPGTERGLVKTGLIALSSIPSGASVYVGKSRYTAKTPTVIRDILPGSYQIKVVLMQHKPWIRTVSVEAEKATALEHIVLLPEELTHEVISSEAFHDILPIAGTDAMLISKGARLGQWFLYHAKANDGWPIAPPESPLRSAIITSYETVPESQALLLRVRIDRAEQFLWVDLREPNAQIEDLTSLFPERPSRVLWDPAESRYLFAFQRDVLNRVERSQRAIMPQLVSHVRGYGLFERSLYVLRDDGMFIRMDLDGKRPEPIMQGAVNINPALFNSKQPVYVELLSKQLAVWLGNHGELFANVASTPLIEKGVLGFQTDSKRQRVLVWQKDKVGIVTFALTSDGASEDEVFPELRWVFEKGERIKQAAWVYEGSHILFQDANEVFLVDASKDLAPELHHLLRVKPKSSIAYVERLGALYYLEEPTGHFCSTKVIPRKEPLLFGAQEQEAR